VLPAGPHGNVLRVLSPLVISDEDLETGLSAIEDAVRKVSSGVMAVA
jgi:4-aminobutyrate aminotransferase-like enzyme